MPRDQILSTTQRSERRSLPMYSLHLDVIRGVASWLVLIGHLHLIVTGHANTQLSAGETTAALSRPAAVTGLGHASVVVFFVLSGYLVGGSVLRDLGRRSFSWVKYALARLTRLWVVLLPAIALTILADAMSAHFFAGSPTFARCSFASSALHSPDWRNILANAAFLQSVPHFENTLGTNVSLWSLSNEFWYYVLFAVFAVSLASTWTAKPIRVVLAALGCFLLWFVGPNIAAYLLLWLCGVLVYSLPVKIPAAWRGAWTLLAAAQLCGVLGFIRTHAFKAILADSLLAVSFMFLLYVILHHTESAQQGPYWHVAHALSFPSYSLYAIHTPLCILLAAFLETHVHLLARHASLLSGAVFVSVLGCTGLFYFVFERNTDMLRRSLHWHLPFGLSARGSYH